MKPSMWTMTLWAIVVALAIGFVAGRMWTPSGIGATTATGSPVPDATATREAELLELERLQTQVAEQATACAPTPTPAATATPVPPTAQGVPVNYVGNWTITVTSAATALNVGDQFPEGIYILVNMTITNNESTERFFDYGDFRLVDSQGRVFVEDVFVASRVNIDNPINFQFDPNLPTDTVAVFDVAEDVGTEFILESTADPTFRVQVSLEMRG
jgi:hypothetical protein